MSARDLAITLAGGGNRALYSLGLLERHADRLLPRVAAIAGVSAGACMAAAFMAGRAEAMRRFFHWRRREVHTNWDWSALLRGERPAPHGPVYRDSVVHAFEDGGLAALKAAPFPVLAVTAALPSRWPRTLGVAVGYGAYSLEKKLRPAMVHPSFGRRLGFQPRVFDLRACETPSEAADLILASSATPPFTPFGSFRGDVLLDGGMVDNVPAFAAEEIAGVRRNLVLLTRPYPQQAVGHQGHRLYLAPSRPTPAECWDYTSSERVEETLAMGREEAALHAASIERFLADRAD